MQMRRKRENHVLSSSSSCSHNIKTRKSGVGAFRSYLTIGTNSEMFGKHQTIILQKDFKHRRAYRHIYRGGVKLVESCCRDEAQHIFNTLTKKRFIYITDAQ